MNIPIVDVGLGYAARVAIRRIFNTNLASILILAESQKI